MIINDKKNNQQGMSLILPVLLLGMVGISIFLMMAAMTIGSISSILPQRDAAEARSYLFGCLDEYLVHLPSDPEFSPTTLNYLEATCLTTVATPSVGQKQIVLTTSVNLSIKKMTVWVQLDPLAIIKVTEP